MDSQLRAHRRKAGLSQQQLGDKAGMSRQAINQIENQHWKPSLRHAMKLARILGTSLEELFGEENT